MAFLSQAPPLGGLLPPHGAFQEHAAHPPRWPGELSSKGSSDTCISAGVFHIPMPCFHGAQIANRIEDFPHVDLTRAPSAWALLGRRDHRFHDCPLLVREIRGIDLARKAFLSHM